MAISPKYLFLQAVLGESGANALTKAAKKMETIESVLVPRTILGWIDTMARYGYEGEIPGTEATISFTKSEDKYVGKLVWKNKEEYQFNDASVYHVAATVAYALNLESLELDSLRNLQVEKLGKSIDTIIKSQLIKSTVADIRARSLNKAAMEPPGAAAKPTAPIAPTTAPKQKKQVATKPPSSKGMGAVPKISASLKLSESQANHTCEICGLPQIQNGTFKGCLCLRDLAKHIKTKTVNGHLELSLSGLDEDAIETIKQSLGIE